MQDEVLDCRPYSAEEIDTLANKYRIQRFALLPHFLSISSTQELYEQTLDVPSRRVICGNTTISWDEQNFPAAHAANQFFGQRNVAYLIGALAAGCDVGQRICWTSSYSKDEYINPHRDGAGLIQLLVCLRTTPSPEHGGVLMLGEHDAFLSPGDAVAFEATTVRHWTSPLIATPDCLEPRRVVLISRFFEKTGTTKRLP